MAGPIKHNEVIEDNLFKPTIEEAKTLVAVLNELKTGFQDVLTATRQQAKTNAFSNFQDVQAASEHLNTAKTAANELLKVENQLTEATKRLAAAQKGEVDELTKTKLQLQATNAETKRQAKEQLDLGSEYDKQSARLNNLRRKYKDLALQNKENTKEGKALRAEIQTLDGRLKDIDATVGQHQRNVGNYQSALEGLPGPMGGIVKGFQAMKTTALAFIATPIGAILGALALVVGVVAGALKRFTPFMDKMNEVFAGLSGIVTEAINRIQQFGSGLMDILSGDFEAGFDKISGSVSNLGEGLATAYTNASNLEKEMKKISDLKRADAVQDSAVEAQIDILIAKSKNLALTFKERAALLNQAKKLEQDKYNGDIELLEREIKAEETALLAKTQLNQKELKDFVSGYLTREQVISKIGQLTDEELDKLSGFYVERNRLDQQSVSLQERINSREESLLEKRDAEIEKNNAKKEAKRLKDEKDAEEIVKAGFALEALKIANMKDGLAKQIAEQNLNYRKQQYEFRANAEALIELEKAYNTKVLQLIAEDKKAREDAQKELRKNAFDNFTADVQYQQDLATAKLEQRRGEFEDEKKWEEFKAAELRKIRMEAIQRQLDGIANATGKEFDLMREQLKAELAGLQAEAKAITDATNEEVRKKNADNLNKLAAETNKYFDKQAQKRDEALNKEVESSKKRQDELRQLAISGNKDAQASIAAEDKRQAEIERARQKALQQQKRRELGLAAINTYNSKVQSGDKNALGNTLKDLTLLSAAVSALPLFYEGTEDTGKGGNIDSKGGFLSVLHPGERVVTAEQNKLFAGIANDEAARVMDMYNRGMLSATQVPVFAGGDSTAVVDLLDKKLTAIEKAVANLPTYDAHVDTVKQIVVEQWKSLNTTKKKTTRIGGIWDK